MFVLFVLEQSILCHRSSTCNPKVKSMRACVRACGELLFPAGPTIPYRNSLDVLISQL